MFDDLTTDLLSSLSTVVALAVACLAVLAGLLAIAETSAAASEPPSVGSVSVSGVTEHDAILEALIGPDGLQTTYRFKLAEGCYPASCGLLLEIPLPSGSLAGGEEPQAVSLDLESAGVSLRPGARYYYSVSATNAEGTTEGPPSQMFMTVAAPEAPVEPHPAEEQSSAPRVEEPTLPTLLTTPPPLSVAPSSPQATTPPTVKQTVSPRSRSREQLKSHKLSRALSTCRHEAKRKRPACERRARHLYGFVAKRNKKPDRLPARR